MDFLVLGASGLIGRAVCREMGEEGHIVGTYFKNKPSLSVTQLQFDVSKDNLTELLEKVRPNVIVSCLRGEFDDQFHIHEQAAHWAKDYGAKIVFLSTANVFDGVPNGPHIESDKPEALSLYGKYKISCEKMLDDILGKQLVIVRLPLVFNLERLRKLVSHDLADEGKLYENLYKSLNRDSVVAGAIRFIIMNNCNGIIHLGSSDCIRDSYFITSAAEKLGLSTVGIREDYFDDETYCRALGCESTDGLATKNNSRFYQVLNTVRSDIPQAFHPSCNQIMNIT